METEILVLFHLLATAPRWRKGIFAKTLFETPRKSKRHTGKTCSAWALLKSLSSQEVLTSPAASSWIHLPLLARGLPVMCASPGNPLPFSGAPVHFATCSFPSHEVLPPVPPALPWEEEEGFSPAAPTSKGCYRGFLINLTPQLNVNQRESAKAVPCRGTAGLHKIVFLFRVWTYGLR